MSLSLMSEAYEEIAGSFHLGLSCEHAGHRFPAGYELQAEDKWLENLHWCVDLGAKELTEELAAALKAPALLALWSRLLIDLNRDLSDLDLIRTHAEGKRILLNAAVDEQEKAKRVAQYYQPYRAALDAIGKRDTIKELLSLHTFTPAYDGQQREVEVGVLFRLHNERAHELIEHLTECGYVVRANEPYSGKEGLIFSIERAASFQALPYLELEVRQDLATDPLFRKRIVSDLRAFYA